MVPFGPGESCFATMLRQLHMLMAMRPASTIEGIPRAWQLDLMLSVQRMGGFPLGRFPGINPVIFGYLDADILLMCS